MESRAISLQRVALAFRSEEIPTLVRWSNYRGYATDEGKLLNETAREFGDDPDNWWVSEAPVDVSKVVEVWGSKSIIRPHLERTPGSYVDWVKRTVAVGRQHKIFIPPTWLDPDQARRLAARLNLPILG